MTLSTFGAAVKFDSYQSLQDWICDTDRPIEIQDFVFPDVIAGDCSELIGKYKEALEPHRGPRGIHGPFFGLDLSNPDRAIRAVIQERFLKGLEIAESLSDGFLVGPVTRLSNFVTQ